MYDQHGYSSEKKKRSETKLNFIKIIIIATETTAHTHIVEKKDSLIALKSSLSPEHRCVCVLASVLITCDLGASDTYTHLKREHYYPMSIYFIHLSFYLSLPIHSHFTSFFNIFAIKINLNRF